MTSKTLKEFGLEFINEMAKDREVAQQEIGVIISGTKSSFVSQGSQHFTYQDLDTLVKIIRKETAKIVDSELTKITIKSLGRIRELIQGDTRIIKNIEALETDQRTDEYEAELEQLRSQLKEKNSLIGDLEERRNELQKEVENIHDELDKLRMEINRLQVENQSLKEQNDLNLRRFEEVSNELQARNAVIENLKEREKIHDKDIEEALVSVAQTYKIQEDYYQRMLEEGIQQRLKTIRKEYDLELEEIKNQLKNEVERHNEDVKQSKMTISRLEEELSLMESELEKNKEKLAKIFDERTQSNLLMDYTQRLLSTHPLYASILILLNLGGSLDLPTLAMSVGAHPLKLRQMLEDLVAKGLITVSSEDPPIVTAVMTQI
ncbi:MAG: hypothetical protein ACTSPV_06630 [Candidatus Hodarchaeales archaeon]